MDVREQVAQLSARRGLGHAYLIEGDATAELTLALMCALVCDGAGDKPCMTCAHCKKAAAGIHPDGISILPEPGKELTVKQMRAMRSDVYIRPNEAQRKVYRIADAHRMNQSAQNALLTVLEDGPRYAAFLLETPSAALLLPTIVSRCEGVRVLPDAALSVDGETGADAAALAKHMLGGDEAKLYEFCMTLEKKKRDALVPVLDGAAALLTAQPQPTAAAQRAALCAISALRRCRAACAFNVGLGHIAGYLSAAVFCPGE